MKTPAANPLPDNQKLLLLVRCRSAIYPTSLSQASMSVQTISPLGCASGMSIQVSGKRGVMVEMAETRAKLVACFFAKSSDCTLASHPPCSRGQDIPTQHSTQWARMQQDCSESCGRSAIDWVDG